MSAPIPWNLPGRSGLGSPGTNTFKSTLARSLGFSRTFNDRNLEYLWYPLWCSTLVDLVADSPNLIVAPQHPVYFSIHDLEVWEVDQGLEEEPEGDTPEEVEIPGSGGQANDSTGGEPAAMDIAPANPDNVLDVLRAHGDSAFGEDDTFDAENEISFSTVAGFGVSEVHVDYAVLHVKAIPSNEVPDRYYGWRITELSVPVIVEEKRFPSRSLTGERQRRLIYNKIFEAAHQLYEQASHLFFRHPEMQAVTAIAASGPYWSDLLIHRNDVSHFMPAVANNVPRRRLPFSKEQDLLWSVPLCLDVPQSTARLRTIYERLRQLGPPTDENLIPQNLR
ncbi:hypothetical protein HYDPIDRAFT_108162 [Hydnomerulius pinastri MD-312]|nr:hypothetical protein HYDPIDRAFT_108162 [Hydnomerulius pinastri MD-312]